LEPPASWNSVAERTPRQLFATVLMIIALSIEVISLRWHAWSWKLTFMSYSLNANACGQRSVVLISGAVSIECACQAPTKTSRILLLLYIIILHVQIITVTSGRVFWQTM
jgi:hypothetical protein